MVVAATAARAILQIINARFPLRQEHEMNKDIIAGKWSQIKGKAQIQWGDLTNDVFDVAEGSTEYLSGKLQEQYGWDRDRAEKEIKEFERMIDSE